MSVDSVQNRTPDQTPKYVPQQPKTAPLQAPQNRPQIHPDQYLPPQQQTSTMPPIPTQNINVKGGTAADLQAQLQFIWNNGGAKGQQVVTDFINYAKNNKVDVTYGPINGGAYMQAGPAGTFHNAVWNISTTANPATMSANDRTRFMMSFVHEMDHMISNGGQAGTTAGEIHAYLQGYDFLKGLGLSNQQIRDTIGSGDPSYLFGTMVDEYQIDPYSKSFADLVRALGVGGSGLGDWWSTLGWKDKSGSPLDPTGQGLDKNQLWEIIADIYNGGATTAANDLRNLSDNPNDPHS